MRQGKSIDNRILRAKFSSITPQDIKRAMNKLVSPNELDAKAVDTRQELDLKIGCAFTRFQTRFFQGKYANLDSSVISFGPCQTPTLALCVKRHDDILSFQPEPFYTIAAKVRIDGNLVELDHTRDRIFVKKKATEIVESLKNVKSLL
jgi:DNA topoisomerase-3